MTEDLLNLSRKGAVLKKKLGEAEGNGLEPEHLGSIPVLVYLSSQSPGKLNSLSLNFLIKIIQRNNTSLSQGC